MFDFTDYEEDRYKELYNSFLEHLTRWTQTGETPPEGSKAVKLFLEMKNRRLQRNGLREERYFTADDDVTGCLEFKDNVYATGRTVQQHLSFYSNGKRIYRHAKPVFVRALVLDLGKGPGQKDQPYTCPNCGAIDTLEHLSGTGCSYCKSRFEMRELFPKILSFYNMDDTAESGIMKRRTQLSMLVCGLLPVVFSLFMQFYKLGHLRSIADNLFGSLFLFALGAAFGFMLHNVLYIAYVALRAVISLPFGFKMTYSKGKAKRYLRKIDPNVSYEYIQSKALTLLQQIVFSEAPEQLTIYQGEPLGDTYADIVDLDYRGAFGLAKGRFDGQNHLMTIDVPTKLLVRAGRGLKKEKRTFRMVMAHRAGVPLRYNFSIHVVSCKSCGASFDAYTQKCCPYCGSLYEPKLDDWAVISIQDR